MATDAERIELLQGAMKESGQSFDQMGRFMKKAVAEASGASVQDAMGLFGANISEVEAKTKAVDTQGATFKNLALSARQYAVGYKEQHDAIMQSVHLEEKAFKQVEEFGKTTNAVLKEMGKELSTYIGQHVRAALGDMNKVMKTVKELAQNKDWMGVLQALAIGAAEVPIIATARLAGEAVGATELPGAQTPAPSMREEQERDRAARERFDTIEKQIQKLEKATGAGAPGAPATEPTPGATPEGAGTPVQVTSNIIVKLEEAVLARFVETQIAKNVLPWRA